MTTRDGYDYVIIGAGMGGLTVGALLAHAGAKVALVEAHEYPGGCCHTFPMGDDYKFCAAVHYIFSCGEGEPIYNLLRALGLHDTITFERLDPEGYDHFSCPSAGIRFRIPNGLAKWGARMCDRFPDDAERIRSFFRVVTMLAAHIDELPERYTPMNIVRAIIASPAVVQVARYRSHTLQKLMDEHRLSPAVQAIVATQMGDLGLPPRDVSLLIWVALVSRYGDGAYYPTEHFSSLIDGITNTIAQAPGCSVAFNTEIASVRMEGDRVSAVVSTDGREFSGARFICNADPKWFVGAVGRERFPREWLKRVEYEYSASSFSLYLGVRGDLDLRAHGFGNWNVWHYPSLDINAAYDRQHARDDLSDPWLFISTPTLCSPHAKTRHAPEGDNIIEVITTCGHLPFEERQARGLRDYTDRKNTIRDRMIDILEEHYLPDVRKHVDMRVAGTPTTNKRYLWAPRGNIYGSALTPRNVDATRLGGTSPIENLFFVGAASSFPSIGGTVGGGMRLFNALSRG